MKLTEGFLIIKTVQLYHRITRKIKMKTKIYILIAGRHLNNAHILKIIMEFRPSEIYIIRRIYNSQSMVARYTPWRMCTILSWSLESASLLDLWLLGYVMQFTYESGLIIFLYHFLSQGR